MSDEASTDPRAGGAAPAAPLDAATVRALARVAGYASLDEATIERMAAGAASAVRAVRASVGVSLMDVEPGQFAAELERLAAER
jgi:hypothetical protein